MARRWRWLAAIVVTGLTAACGAAPPDDEAMIRHLQAERPAFEALAAMMAAEPDTMMVVYQQLLWNRSHLPPARAARYRALMTQTGCGWLARSAAGTITCRYSGWALPFDQARDYVRAAAVAPSPLRARLDAGGLPVREHVYRHVDGPWYLGGYRSE